MSAHRAAPAPAPCPLVWPWRCAVGEVWLIPWHLPPCGPLCSRTSLQEFSPLSAPSASLSLLGYFLLHSHGIIVTILREEYHHIAFQLLPHFPVPSYRRISWKALSGLPAFRSSPPIPSWTRSTEGVRFGESPEGVTTARKKDVGPNGLRNKDIHRGWKPQVSCNRGQK